MAEATLAAENIETENPEELTDENKNFELRSIREIVRDLSKPVAKRHLRVRRQGGKEIGYIAWHDAIKYLDHYAPGWTYEVRNMQSIGGKLILTIRLSVPCLEGIVFREATGQEDEEKDTYGDSSSNAESMALRRAAAKFGLGLYLYDQ
ncbi:MAG: RAD52 family DNA repair protein [Acidobacteriota bacterium]|nr:RAD52 family DNA repair protein [Acidobacteriota bacterium]